VNERSAPTGLQVYYGGTFDPIHEGHLAVACAARDACDCDIRLLPAADPPHRAPPGAAASDRAAMVALAIRGIPRLRLDLRELDRDGPSWTIDTLQDLRAELGAHAPIAWLVGADSFLGLPTWKRWRELLDLAHCIVADRPGSPLEQALPAPLGDLVADRWAACPEDLLTVPAGRVMRLRQPLREHSASDLRRRIGIGEPWRELVPAPVADYIAEHRLYGDAGDSAVIRTPSDPSL
jgi:nicotinate-nucleotide adenylyltransferase